LPASRFCLGVLRATVWGPINSADAIFSTGDVSPYAQPV